MYSTYNPNDVKNNAPSCNYPTNVNSLWFNYYLSSKIIVSRTFHYMDAVVIIYVEFSLSILLYMIIHPLCT
jgi:hypothetical protein